MAKYLLIVVIGNLMTQLNALIINTPNNIELKDESVSADSSAKSEDFSQYIDQHIAKNKQGEASSKADSVKENEKATHNSQLSTDVETETETKISNDLLNSAPKSDEADMAVLKPKVATIGNEEQIKANETNPKAIVESEQLMSFLTKADKTLVNQVANTSSATSSEQGSAEQTADNKAHNEAQLLLDSSDLVADLSAVAKALSKEQTKANPAIPLTEQATSNKNSDLNSVVKVIGKESTNAKLVNELSTESKDNKPVETPVPLIKTAGSKAVLSKEVQGDGSLDVKEGKDLPLSAEQKNIKQVDIVNAQRNEVISDNSLSKEIAQNSQIEEADSNQLAVNEKANTISKTNDQGKVALDKLSENEVDKIEKQVKQSLHEKAANLADTPLTKNEIASNSDTLKLNETANIKKAASANNPLNSGDLNLNSENKAQAQQEGKKQISASFTEQSEQGPVVKNEDEASINDKTVSATKREASTNNHVIDVASRATQTPQHIIEQQSAGVLSPSSATEITQNQKTNTQLHQETISLFRKDATEAVKDKVMLMISQKLQRFDITLDPPELGNMQVRVNLQGEQAAVNFIVQNQQTKDALEQNMHKLKDLLAEQGVDVGDANVEQQSQQSTNEEGPNAGSGSQVGDNRDNLAEADDVIAQTLSAQMIDSSTASVDYYA